jgi:iron(III) transport system ATP-binding protein
VGKAPFLGAEHSSINSTPGESWICRLGRKTFEVSRYSNDVDKDNEAVIMARPESLRLAAPGMGAVEGIVRMNVYLGHSIESFVETKHGEVLVQIDDPASKKIYAEGQKVSIEFNANRIRLLKND